MHKPHKQVLSNFTTTVRLYILQCMNHFYKDSIIFVYHILVFVCFHVVFYLFATHLVLSCFCCINNLIVSFKWNIHLCIVKPLFFSNFAYWLRKLDLCENYYIYTVLNESEHISYTVLNIRFFIFPYINHVGINDEINW